MPKNHEQCVKQAVVKIRCQGQQGHLGTGFFVSSQLIVTCAHVSLAREDRPLEILTFEEEWISVAVHYESTDYNNLDLAVLKLVDRKWGGETLSLHPEYETGDELYAYGFPSAKPQGDAATFEVIGQDGEGLLKFKDGLATPGFSGSPLWNLRTGKICAVMIISLDQQIPVGGRGVSVSQIWQACPELRHQTKVPNPFVPLSDPLTPDQLTGRDEELRQVFNRLNSGGSVAIIGAMKSGKTSLLKAIAAQAPQRLTVKRQCIELNLAYLASDQDFYAALCDEMLIEPAILDGGYRFKKAVREKRALLLLDGIQEMTYGWLTQQVRSQLRALANNTESSDNQPIFRLVVAAHQPLKTLFSAVPIDSPFEEICSEVSLRAWDGAIIREFIQQRLQGTRVMFPEEQIQAIIAQSDGRPFTVMQRCHEIYQGLQAF